MAKFTVKTGPIRKTFFYSAGYPANIRHPDSKIRAKIDTKRRTIPFVQGSKYVNRLSVVADLLACAGLHVGGADLNATPLHVAVLF